MSEEHQLQQLKIFLEKIQLVQFYDDCIQVLHITRIEHFDHVVEGDLKSIGLSMPEVRRLFDHLKKNKKTPFLAKLKKSFGLTNESDVTNYSKNKLEITIAHGDFSKEPKGDKKCLIQEKDISFLELLGRGAFGYVQSAEWRTSSNEKVLVAVKSIRSTGGNGVSDVQCEVVKEANAMSQLRHPNLIKFYGIVISQPFMLVTELAPLGALLKRLRHEPHRFFISTLSSFLVQIIAGMKYLENNKIVHRDLAARNILLMSYEKVKIGDFGLARSLDDRSEYYVMNPTGGLIPFAWSAPECLKYKRFSHASDIWAFGVTAYELFSYGGEPWVGLTGAQIYDRINEPNCETLPRPENCPHDIYDVICNCCWKFHENERTTFQSLEKNILEVLPRELTATNSSKAFDQLNNNLEFSVGDFVTVFDIKSTDHIWKGQNRSTGKLGDVPCHWVDFSTVSLSARSENAVDYAFITKEDGTRENTDSEEKSSDPLWGIYHEISDDGTGEHPTNKFSDQSSEINSLSSSGYATENDSIQECFSTSNSVDSGFTCRCNSYSSDTSSSVKGGIPSSNPISIPGTATKKRHRHSGSFTWRFSSSSNHVQSPIMLDSRRKRCSVCNSNRSSIVDQFSPVELSNSSSPKTSSPLSNKSRLKRAFSMLKLDSRRSTATNNSPNIAERNRSTTLSGERTKSSMGSRRPSLPNLLNSRKYDYSKKSLKKRKESSFSTGSKFFVQTRESLVSSPKPIDLSSQCTASLYDLIPNLNNDDSIVGLPSPIVDNSEDDANTLRSSNNHNCYENENDDRLIENNKDIENPLVAGNIDKGSELIADINGQDRILFADEIQTHTYMTPSAIAKSCDDMTNLQNLDHLHDVPVVPPRRKKKIDSKSQVNVNEFENDVHHVEQSPRTKQCIILDE